MKRNVSGSATILIARSYDGSPLWAYKPSGWRPLGENGASPE